MIAQIPISLLQKSGFLNEGKSLFTAPKKRMRATKIRLTSPNDLLYWCITGVHSERSVTNHQIVAAEMVEIIRWR